jgi:hypothetical protein
MQGSFLSELHHHRVSWADTCGKVSRFGPVFEQSEKPVSCLSSISRLDLNPSPMSPRRTEDAGSLRSPAWVDLQLGQRTTGTPADLHPLYGETSPAHLQSRGNATLHYWWTLPRYTQRNRRVREEASKSYKDF